MGTFWPDGGRWLKNADFFTGVQWPLLHVFLINLAIISDTALSEDLVFLKEGLDEFTSAHPSLLVSDVLSSREGAEKVYLCKGPPYLPHLSTKTRKNKFALTFRSEIQIWSLKLLDRLAQFYEEMKAAKEMAAQVLVRDLPFEIMDGDNDPPPLNAEICHFDNSCCR